MVVEIGAVVHSGSVLGANVHLGSGAIVGPDVEIGQETKIGYAFFSCPIFNNKRLDKVSHSITTDGNVEDSKCHLQLF